MGNQMKVSAAAKQMNKIMSTKIKTDKSITDDIVKNQILSHSAAISALLFVTEPASGFTAETIAFFASIGIVAAEPNVEAPAKVGKATKTAEQKAEEAAERAAKKLEAAELLAAGVEKKAAAKAAAKAQKEADAAAAKAEKAAATFTWSDATEEAIRLVARQIDGGTMADIRTLAIIGYNKRNGEQNEVPKNVFRYMVNSLVRFGILLEADGKFTFADNAEFYGKYDETGIILEEV